MASMSRKKRANDYLQKLLKQLKQMFSFVICSKCSAGDMFYVSGGDG